jgi:hypothetical protein
MGQINYQNPSLRKKFEEDTRRLKELKRERGYRPYF